MKYATITDLRYHFPKVERLLREGHEVFITRMGKVVYRLIPSPEFSVSTRARAMVQWVRISTRPNEMFKPLGLLQTTITITSESLPD